MHMMSMIHRACKNLIRERGRLFLSFLFLMVALLMLGIARMFFAARSWGLKECDRVLARGIDGTGVFVKEGDLAGTNLEAFLEAAIDSGMVDAVGTFGSGHGFQNLPELLEQQRHFKTMNSGDAYLWGCVTTRGSLGLCNLRFREKADVTEEKWEASNWCGIYLGASFHDIPLGTVFSYSTGKGDEYVYEVIGLLEQNQRVIGNGVILGCHENGYESSIRLDDQVLFIAGSKRAYFSNSFAYTPAEGVTLQEAEDFLKKLAAEKRVQGLEFKKMQDGFRETRLEEEMVSKVLKKLGIVLALCCVLINVGTLILQFQARRREFGILYACGYSRRDLSLLFLSEHAVKTICALVISMAGLYVVAKSFFSLNQNSAWVLNFVMGTDILPWMFAMAVLFVLLFAAVPIGMLMQAYPVQLMRESRG